MPFMKDIILSSSSAHCERNEIISVHTLDMKKFHNIMKQMKYYTSIMEQNVESIVLKLGQYILFAL